MEAPRAKFRLIRSDAPQRAKKASILVALADADHRRVGFRPALTWASVAEVAKAVANNEHDGEALFLALFQLFEPLIQRAARGSGLTHADAEDFMSSVHERLIENDYAILRICVARDQAKAYMAAVIAHFLCDYRNAEWGRWRPSAAVQKLGPIAIKLAKLMERDHVPLIEAVRIICSANPTITEADVMAIARQIEVRAQWEEVDIEGAGAVEPPEEAAMDLDETGKKVQQALTAALRELLPEDLLILRLHFCNGCSVADISRILKLEQKPLYRRMQHIQATLRSNLLKKGIDASVARDVVGNHFMTSFDWCGE